MQEERRKQLQAPHDSGTEAGDSEGVTHTRESAKE